MSKIIKDTPCLFIRLIDYKKNNFIEEHMKTFKENGIVWLLKMGKPAKETFIKDVIKNGGYLITKATARNGNDFYICKIEEYSSDEIPVYPNYYKEIFEDGYYDTNDILKLGTWFKIVELEKVEDKIIDKFVTISTGRSLLECGKKFNQVSQMHVKAKEDIIF